MEYNYSHERQENRANPETSQGHPQNQHLLHYQHQQYPPSHHAIQAGYPGLRLTPYMNPLQGAGAPVGLVHTQEGGLVQAPRVPTSASAGSTRDSSQSSNEFENVLSNVMQGSSVQGHYQQEPPPHSQHGLPLQQITPLPSRQASPPLQQTQAHTGGGDSYHIEDLSHATHNTSQSRMPNSSSGGVAMITAPMNTGEGVNTTKSNSQIIASTGRTPKKRAAPGSSPKQPSKQPHMMRGPMAQITMPQVYQQTPQVIQQQSVRERISFSKHCQTEPLFQQVYQASMQFSKDKELPEGLELREDEKEKKITGVVATKDFDIGVEFGPFTGDFVKEGLGCFNPNTWEVCVKGQTWYYIDGATDPNNWMHHVQYARNTDEQNVEAFQFYGDIYFRIIKPIKSGTELRVFYSKDYCNHVGFKACLDKLLFFKDAQRFECRDCDNRYTNSKSLFRHIKFEHDKENNLIPPDHVEPAKSHPPPKPKIPNLMTIKDVAAKMQRDKELNAEKNKARERPKVDKSKRFMKVKLVPLEKSEKHEKEEEFSCKRCRKKFPSEGHLKEHAAFHKEMKDVKPICEVCGLECKHTKALKQHQLVHNPDAYQCEYCKKFFRRKGCLVYHLRHVHQTFVGEKWTRGNAQEQMTRYVGPGEEDDEDDFHPELPKDMLESDQGSDSEESSDSDQSTDFDEQDEDQAQSKEHTPKQTQDQRGDKTREESKTAKPVCAVCGEECKHSLALKQHLLSHDPNSYQCQYCDWFFKRKGCLVFHLRSRHNISLGRKWLRGTIEELLDKGNNSEDDSDEARLEEELRRQKRVKSLKHICKLCGERCESARALNQHTMSHNPNNYQCQYCKWYFKRKGCLVFHLRTRHQVSIGKKWSRLEKEELMEPDTIEDIEEDREDEDDDFTGEEDDSVEEDQGSEESYTDEEDDKGNSDQEQVPGKILRRMDSKASIFTCKLCGKEFEKFRAMEQHVMSHDPNNYQCTYCKWYFKRKCDLVFHLRSKHQVSIGKKWTRFDKEELMEPNEIDNIDEEDNEFTCEDEFSVEDDKDMEQSLDDEEDGKGNDDQEQVPGKILRKMDSKASCHTCKLCGKEFEKFRAMEQHVMSHDPNNYQCTYCKWYFRRKCDLVFHLRSKHQVSIGKKWTRFDKEELMEPDKIDNIEEDDELTGEEDYSVEGDKDMKQSLADEEDGKGNDDQEQVPGKILRKMDSKASCHTCKLCGKEFEKFRAMEQHMISHDPNNYQCTYCKWYFRRKWDLVFHLRSKHQVSIGKKWSRFDKEELMELDKIGNIEEEDDEFTGVKDYSVEEDKNMEQSLADEEDGKGNDDQELAPGKFRRRMDSKASSFTCKLCGKEFEKFRAMEQHVMSHDPNNYQCTYCKWYFKRKFDLVFHLRSKHQVSVGKKWTRFEKEELMELDKIDNIEEEDDSRTVYNCKFCSQKFTKRDFLIKHEAIVHVNLMTYRCRVCRKAFSSQGALQAHSHIHEREKRFECFICQQKFSSNGLLVKHLMHHEKPDNSEMVFAAMQQDVANEGAGWIEVEPADPTTNVE